MQLYLFFSFIRRPLRSTLFPYTTLFRSHRRRHPRHQLDEALPTRRGYMGGCQPERMEAVTLLRSEEHTSELQSLRHLVCRLLLEKKKITTSIDPFRQVLHALGYVEVKNI